MRTAVVMSAVLWAIIIGTADYAFSHSWYPRACCSERDCFEVTDDDVKVVNGGYLVQSTGEFFPYGKETDYSPDGKFHRCAHLGGPNKGKTICLFVPGAGT